MMIVMSFYFQNVTEHRFPWDECFRVYQTKAADNDVECRKTSEVVKLKMDVLQHLCALLTWFKQPAMQQKC